MNTRQQIERSSPGASAGIPAGHPALAGGDTPLEKNTDAIAAQGPAGHAIRTPPRVRKVDSGEVYRFWAFR